MREWRKLYRGITQSDKAAKVSDAAFALFCLLIANQDDAGRYPWNKAKVRALTVTRDWTLDVTYQLRNELVQAGLVTDHAGYVEIVGGAEKNGPPKNGPDRHKKPMMYEIDTTSEEVRTGNADGTDVLRNSYVLEEKRREEKRERETPFGGKEKDAADAAPAVVSKKRAKVKPFVSEQFIQRMEERFSPTLGGTVRERIAEALGHKAARNVIDEDETGALSWERYVTGWLRRDAERTPPGSARPPYRNGHSPPLSGTGRRLLGVPSADDG